MWKRMEPKVKPSYLRIKARLDEDDYQQLLEKTPEIIDEIEAGIAAGDTPENIGRIIRSSHPHKWLQSKIFEGAARYILAQQNEG